MPRTLTIVPAHLRDLASWVIDECVRDAGIGGFATKDISPMLNWLLRNPSVQDVTYRKVTHPLTSLEDQPNVMLI